MFFFDSSVFLNQFRKKLEFDLSQVSKETRNREHDVFRDHFLKNFDKKFIIHGASINTEEEALLTFLRVNRRMGMINKSYPSYHTMWSNNKTLNRARLIISFILGPPPTMEEVFQRCNHSSGTSVGVSFIDTSLEAKMKFPLSGTRTACHLWEHYKFFDWEFYNQACNLNEVSGVLPETVTVDGSRAATVPKSNRTDRMIAVEPTLNMFFQQGLMHLMDDRLSSVGLAKSVDQEKHRSLAFQASVTGRYSTIDFSSMSDSISLSIAHFLLPKGWYHWFWSLRCHKISIKGKFISPEMISTMGNATTFPLETLILYAIGCASIWTTRGYSLWPSLSTLDMRVFGDDCILPTDCAALFMASCESCGFRVNRDKSFLDGSFRESCGGDFDRGRDVRPSFLESLPRTERSRRSREAYLYRTINGVIRSYIKYFGTVKYVYDKHLLRYLFSLLSSVTNSVKFVPEHFPEDAGICHLRDIDRFLACYQLRPSRVGVDIHGSLDFLFLRYMYPNKGSFHDGLRYTSLLKKGIFHQTEDPMKENRRRKGGFYVESRSREVLVRLPSTFFARSSMATAM